MSPAGQVRPGGQPATLAAVAGRLTPWLGAAALPIYGLGAFATHGPARWVMLAMVVLLLGSALFVPSRDPRLGEAPGTVLSCAGIIVALAWLAPAETVLLSGVLGVAMVYVGLMVPRPVAEIGLCAVAVAYVGSQLTLGPGADMALQIAGVAGTDLSLGALMLGIRVITERRVNDHTQSLADANAQLERLSRTDPLTGLANRRRLQDALAETWERAAATGRPVSAIMIDIDFFKQYNDHFGHLGGDSCLQKLAAAVAGGARSTDTVARYGGEEIAVILPDADLGTACRTAERIRQAVTHLAEQHPASPTGFLTVSIGVASAVPGDGGSADDLLERADQHLYEAKRGGRDRVAPDPAASRPTSRAAAA